MKKKTLIIVLASVAGAILLLTLLAAILPLALDALRAGNTDESSAPQTESTADLSADTQYLALDRSIYYSEYGDTEVVDGDNKLLLGDSAGFFYDYFQSVIGGGSGYAGFFTDSYLAKNPLHAFGQQMLYDISATLYSRTAADALTVKETFIVRFKINRNKGDFRVAESDITVSEVFRLVKSGGTVKIEEILDYRVSYD